MRTFAFQKHSILAGTEKVNTEAVEIVQNFDEKAH